MIRILFIVLFWIALAIPLAAQKTAVLIGISKYPPQSGWRTINAHNDLALIKNKLDNTSWDVKVLENEAATHQGIINLLDHIAKTASPGDTIFIHFSCHGQQMVPLKKDTNSEPDLLDEALVPYDAIKQWSSSYDGHNHLRDDELSAHVNRIRNKVGASGFVIVALDACHSDSMERGDEDNSKDNLTILRGTSDIFGDSIIVDSLIKNRYKRDTSKITIDNNSDVVYISACQSHSENSEIVLNGKGYGSLSYSIANAINNGGLKNTTAFLDHVVIMMDSLVGERGQKPGIRASFIYTRPNFNNNEENKSPPDKTTNNEQHHHTNYMLIAAFALLAILIWRIIKK